MKVSLKKMDMAVRKVSVILFVVHMLMIVFNGSKYFHIANRAIIYSGITIMMICLIVCKFIYSHGNINFVRDGFVIRCCCIVILILGVVIWFFVNDNRQLGSLPEATLFFLLLLCWMSNDFSDKEIGIIEKGYIISAEILSITALLMRYRPYTYSLADSERITILSYTGEYYDVNFLASYIAVPTIMLFGSALEHSKWWKWVGISTLCISVLWMGSRAALGVILFSFSIMAGVELCKKLKRDRRLKRRIIIFSFVILIVCLAILWKFSESSTIEHLSRGINPLNDSRRMADWLHGIQLIKHHPVLGNGITSSAYLFEKAYAEGVFHDTTIYLSVHNTYLTFAVNYGIPAACIIILILVYPLYRFMRYHAPLKYFVTYLSFLVLIVLIETNFTDIFIIPIIVFFVSSKRYNSQKCKAQRVRK